VIRIDSHPWRFTRATVLAICVLLGGCQSLAKWKVFSSPDQRQPELQQVDSRDFSLRPEQSVVGGLYAIRLREGDTLPDVARHYGLGYEDIVLANPGVDPWVPPAGSRILLPLSHILPDAPREGIVLNLANMRLYYFPADEGDGQIHTYPVGIGREGWETPTGIARITKKKKNPSWVPPASIRKEQAKEGNPLPRVVPPGPENPLGDYALRLSMPGYLIHGTNKPYGVGMQVSHGCVRLYPEDIEVLFNRISVGNSVRIVDQPYLGGWYSGQLYLEAHAPMKGREKEAERMKKNLLARLDEEARERGVVIDRTRMDEVLQRQSGIPEPVLANSPAFEELAANAPLLAHPEKFYGQPVPGNLDMNSWTIDVASFDDEIEARRVASMLNHQGPPIPASSMRNEQGYRVIAGPFEDRQAALAAAERINRSFEFDARLLMPGAVTGERTQPPNSR